MESTAVAAPESPDRHPLYVLQLEELIRQLDKVIDDMGPMILADHPEDHGLEPWMAALVERLRG